MDSNNKENNNMFDMGQPVPGGNDPYDDGTTSNRHGQQPEADVESAKRQVKKDRIEMTREASARLECVLNGIKSTTKRFLSEINVYMETQEGVTLDHMSVQTNESNENHRLQGVETDVSDVMDTSRLLGRPATQEESHDEEKEKNRDETSVSIY